MKKKIEWVFKGGFFIKWDILLLTFNQTDSRVGNPVKCDVIFKFNGMKIARNCLSEESQLDYKENLFLELAA